MSSSDPSKIMILIILTICFPTFYGHRVFLHHDPHDQEYNPKNCSDHQVPYLLASMLTNWLTPFPTDPGAVGSDPGTFLVRWGLSPGQGGPNREVYPTHHQILPAFWPPPTHQTQPPGPDISPPDPQVRRRPRVPPPPDDTISISTTTLPHIGSGEALTDCPTHSFVFYTQQILKRHSTSISLQ